MLLDDFVSRWGLRVQILPKRDFPSGKMYHHQRPYMLEIRSGAVVPFVFHMCWTESRRQKVEYLKLENMWFVPARCELSERAASQGGVPEKECWTR